MGVLCLASATQDLAVDAYTIDLLDTEELGMANGIRIGAYRVGLIAAGGGVLILSDLVGWSPTFVGVAVIMAALALTVLVFGPFHLARPEVARAQTGKGFGQIKESVQGPDAPSPHGDHHRLHPGLQGRGRLSGGHGEPLLAGHGLFRHPVRGGLHHRGESSGHRGRVSGRRHHRPLGHQPGPVAPGHLPGLLHPGLLGWRRCRAAWHYTIYLATLGENLAGQMGSAAFMAFLMCLCDKRFSASHYAFLSMLFGLSGRLCGYLGGWAAAYFGYATFFFLSFLVAWPAFALLPWVLPVIRKIEGRESVVSGKLAGLAGGGLRGFLPAGRLPRPEFDQNGSGK